MIFTKPFTHFKRLRFLISDSFSWIKPKPPTNYIPNQAPQKYFIQNQNPKNLSSAGKDHSQSMDEIISANMGLFHHFENLLRNE